LGLTRFFFFEEVKMNYITKKQSLS